MTAFNRLQIPLCAKMCRQKDVSAMKGHYVYPVGKQHEQMETMKPVFEFLGATLSNPEVGKSVILSGAHGQTQVRSSQLMHNTRFVATSLEFEVNMKGGQLTIR
jgi:hypothetical protein